MFDEQDSFPEEIDIATVTIGFFDGLLESRNSPARETKDRKKASQNDFASASSDDSSAHSWENVSARSLISFHDNGISSPDRLSVGFAIILTRR